MNNKRKVVVTGMGIVSAIGTDESTVWQNLISGKSGISKIIAFDINNFKAQSGAEIDNAELLSALQKYGLTHFDRVFDIAILASSQALQQAKLLDENKYEVGTIFGTGGGSALNLAISYENFFKKGNRGLRPTTVPRTMYNSISSRISLRFGLTGPNYIIVSACSSSTVAIGTAFRMIKNGYAEQVLCGGTEAIFEPAMYAAWDNLGVMSKNDDPSTACRPFDSARNGCVLGEGAGALLLESMDSAIKRNCRIRAEICGYGEASDAEHITRPNPEGQARAIRNALKSANMQPHEIGFIDAHGTATKANDVAEAKSIRLAMGDASDIIPVASKKSYFGHLLGASGVVETIAVIMGLEKGVMPGNLNLTNKDPQCNISLIGKKTVKMTLPTAMKNSFGFGGNNAVLILKQYP